MSQDLKWPSLFWWSRTCKVPTFRVHVIVELSCAFCVFAKVLQLLIRMLLRQRLARFSWFHMPRALLCWKHDQSLPCTILNYALDFEFWSSIIDNKSDIVLSIVQMDSLPHSSQDLFGSACCSLRFGTPLGRRGTRAWLLSITEERLLQLLCMTSPMPKASIRRAFGSRSCKHTPILYAPTMTLKLCNTIVFCQ